MRTLSYSALSKTVSGAILGLAVMGIGFTFSPTVSRAAIITNDLYHLGEADSPPGVVGGTGDATTVDSVGGNNLTRASSPFPTYGVGSLFSTVSMNFSPGGVYRDATALTTATTDIGFEMWVDPLSTSGSDSFVFMNGNGFASRGQYVTFKSGNWIFAKAGIGTITVAATVNQWINLAYVLDDSGFLHAYINGVQVGSTLTGGSTAALSGDGFALGGSVSDPAERAAFPGLVDEARMFTFTNFASFHPLTDLQLPEPSSMLLLGIAVPLLLRRRKP